MSTSGRGGLTQQPFSGRQLATLPLGRAVSEAPGCTPVAPRPLRMYLTTVLGQPPARRPFRRSEGPRSAGTHSPQLFQISMTPLIQNNSPCKFLLGLMQKEGGGAGQPRLSDPEPLVPCDDHAIMKTTPKVFNNRDTGRRSCGMDTTGHRSPSGFPAPACHLPSILPSIRRLGSS